MLKIGVYFVSIAVLTSCVKINSRGGRTSTLGIEQETKVSSLVTLPWKFFMDNQRLIYRKIVSREGAGTKYYGTKDDSFEPLIVFFKLEDQKANMYSAATGKIILSFIAKGTPGTDIQIDFVEAIKTIEASDPKRNEHGEVLLDSKGQPIGFEKRIYKISKGSRLQRVTKHGSDSLSILQQVSLTTVDLDEMSEAPWIRAMHYELSIYKGTSGFQETKTTTPQHTERFFSNSKGYVEKWNPNKGPLIFKVSPQSPSYFIEAAKQAANYWNQIASEPMLQVVADEVDASQFFENNVIVLVKEPLFGAGGITQYNPENGEVLNGIEIQIPATWFDFTKNDANTITAYKDILTLTIAHELGHSIGLKHNFYNPSTSANGSSERPPMSSTPPPTDRASNLNLPNTVMGYPNAQDRAAMATKMRSSIPFPYDKVCIDYLYSPVKESSFDKVLSEMFSKDRK